ncbi:MAG: helix-turn-helix domain-containing protein [Verrucomicrobiota bacterium]
MNTTPLFNPEDTSNGRDERPLILIVEDDFALQEILIDELEIEFRLEIASNGREGLDKAFQLKPDLIISDVMMPLLDGVSLCKQLKQDESTAFIPIILLTARAAVEAQIEGLGAGADDYVPKPFVMDLLEARIRNLIRSRKGLKDRYEPETLKIDLAKDASPVDQRFVQHLLDVIAENHNQSGFDAEALANAMKMSLRTLQRRVKTGANTSPAMLIREYRMNRAANLLTYSANTVTEISFMVGFNDSSHFSRLFKEHFDINPTEYRSIRRK